jgi:hypothetical protein
LTLPPQNRIVFSSIFKKKTHSTLFVANAALGRCAASTSEPQNIHAISFAASKGNRMQARHFILLPLGAAG